MGGPEIKIGVLTSSRADFGIYTPLLDRLCRQKSWRLEIIAFGTHLSSRHGRTISEIVAEGYTVSHRIVTAPITDSVADIATSTALTVERFAGFWSRHHFDLVFALGDRTEMLAAVLPGFIRRQRFAHISAGETTRGAIDEAFRHSISLMSVMLFVSAEQYKIRAQGVVGTNASIYNVGALNYDAIRKIDFPSAKSLCQSIGLASNRPFALVTLHPETNSGNGDCADVLELSKALGSLEDFSLLITMPNADAGAHAIRGQWQTFSRGKADVICVESLGLRKYLACVRYCAFMIGNSSSGFVEASYFGIPVVNIGARQAGRIRTSNIIDCGPSRRQIASAIALAVKIKRSPSDTRIYGDGRAAFKILRLTKNALRRWKRLQNE
jgi:GDP/UDP-N,N'-diacetylbacillosamine 2-epimerase (hydrolysing)